MLLHHREVQRPRRQKNIKRTQKNTRNKRRADLCKLKINKTPRPPLGVGVTQVHLQGALSEGETPMLWPSGEVRFGILGNLGILLISPFLHLNLSPIHNFSRIYEGWLPQISTGGASILIRFVPCASLGGSPGCALRVCVLDTRDHALCELVMFFWFPCDLLFDKFFVIGCTRGATRGAWYVCVFGLGVVGCATRLAVPDDLGSTPRGSCCCGRHAPPFTFCSREVGPPRLEFPP
jgi:hypothetical protein